jgi:hypothetical protein
VKAPAPAPAPAPVYQNPAPVYQVKPAPASNVPAVPSGPAPIQNVAGAPGDPASDSAAVTATNAANDATVPVATPDDAKIAADKATNDKAAAKKVAAEKVAADEAVRDFSVQVHPEKAADNQAVQLDAARASQTSPINLPVLFLSGGLALAYIQTYGTQSYRIRRAANSHSEVDSAL